MKPSVDEINSDAPRLLWRGVSKNRWQGEGASLARAADDFRLRDNEDYLSFFAVSNEGEGVQIGAAFKVVQHARPASVDFILFPLEFLTAAGILVIPKPLQEAPEILSTRHLGTVGPIHEPDEAFIRRLFDGDSVTIIRMSKAEIIETAKLLVKENPGFRFYLGTHWRQVVLSE